MTTIDFTTTATYVGSRMGKTGTYVHETDTYDSVSRFLVLAENANEAALRTANSVAAWDSTWTVHPTTYGVEVRSGNGLEALVTAEEAPKREVTPSPIATFTVRTMADGDHYYAPRTFNLDYMAEAFYSSTTDRIRKEDGPAVEVTVDMVDDSTGDVVYSTTFPRAEF